MASIYNLKLGLTLNFIIGFIINIMIGYFFICPLTLLYMKMLKVFLLYG